MKYLIFKVLIISILCVLLNSCNSNKSIVNNRYQEDFNDKRQAEFDILYDEYH